MSTTHAMLIALALLICGAYSKLSKWLVLLTEQIECLRNEVVALQSAVEEATMSEAEKYERRESKAFSQAEELTLAYLRQLKPGAILRLISCSWYYPSEFPVFDRFEYKHDYVDEQNLTEFGYEVHGFWRHDPLEAWEPYHFLSKKKEASTSSCSGTIKRLP